jgi:hypothetical protein
LAWELFGHCFAHDSFEVAGCVLLFVCLARVFVEGRRGPQRGPAHVPRSCLMRRGQVCGLVVCHGQAAQGLQPVVDLGLSQSGAALCRAVVWRG